MRQRTAKLIRRMVRTMCKTDPEQYGTQLKMEQIIIGSAPNHRARGRAVADLRRRVGAPRFVPGATDTVSVA